MKELVLSDEELGELVLISYKNFNFEIGNYSCGQYGFERRASIKLIDNRTLIKSHFKSIGLIRLFSTDDYQKESKNNQCLIQGKRTFDECLEAGKEYIIKYVDFIKNKK